MAAGLLVATLVVLAGAVPAGAWVVTSVLTQPTPYGPISVGTALTDQALLVGADSSVSGTVSYAIYANNTCTQLVADLGSDLAVVDDSPPPSTAWVPTVTGHFWLQASFVQSGYSDAVVSSCGSEEVTVVPAVTNTTVAPNLTGTSSGSSVTTTTVISGVTSPTVIPGETTTSVPSTTIPAGTTTTTLASPPMGSRTKHPAVPTTTRRPTTTTTPGTSHTPVPVGAPQTGAGGTADARDPLLLWIGSGLLLAAAAATTIGIRRRPTVALPTAGDEGQR